MTAQSVKPYATVPTLFDRVHDELSAIQEIAQVLGSLPDHETRVRVIAWISDRFSSGFESAAAPDLRPGAADGRTIDRRHRTAGNGRSSSWPRPLHCRRASSPARRARTPRPPRTNGRSISF